MPAPLVRNPTFAENCRHLLLSTDQHARRDAANYQSEICMPDRKDELHETCPVPGYRPAIIGRRTRLAEISLVDALIGGFRARARTSGAHKRDKFVTLERLSVE